MVELCIEEEALIAAELDSRIKEIVASFSAENVRTSAAE